MPSRVAFTVADVLDRGLTAVPGILTKLADTATVSTSDVELAVKNAFVKGKALQIDPGILGQIINAADPLDRATAVIAARYAELGGAGGVLGTTAGAVAGCPDGFGFYRHFRNGSIFWHPVTGVHEVHGPIRAKWAALGWERSVLGYPTSDQLPGTDPDQRGVYNRFQGGAIHWYPPGFGGLVVGLSSVALSSAVLAAAAKPAAAGRRTRVAAGAATTVTAFTLPRTEMSTMNLAGAEADQLMARVTTIGDRGAVAILGDQPTVLGSAAGAFEVHGEIGVHYRVLGGSGSVLGYPTTDETGTPDGVGRFNHFQAGSIYWTPSTGAHEVHGLIRALWASGGWERNAALGYPITDELVPDRRIGHRFPERKRKANGLPPDVLKLPVEALANGFSRLAVNVPAAARVNPALRIAPAPAGRVLADHAIDAVTVSPTVVAGATSAAGRGRVIGTVLDPGVGALVTLNPNLLSPGSSPGATASDNRYGDFENGVLYWQRGATAARALQPWAKSADGAAMTRSPADLIAAMSPSVAAALSHLAGVQFGGLNFVATTSYSYDGANVHNRAHRLAATLIGTQSFGNLGGIFGGGGASIPAIVNVELHVEVAFDPDRRQAVAFLSDWSYADASNINVPVPLTRQLHPLLDALLYQRVGLIDLPDTDDGNPIAVLSVKTLPDGTVGVYVEPDDLRILVNPVGHLQDVLLAETPIIH